MHSSIGCDSVLRAAQRRTHVWLQVYQLMNRDSFGKFQKVSRTVARVQIFSRFLQTDTRREPTFLSSE